MKIFSGLFKVVGVAILVLVVLGLPLALLGRNVGRVVFSPQEILNLLSENLTQPEILSSLAQGFVSARVEEGEGPGDPATALALKGLNEMDDEQWNELIQLLTPPELLKLTTKEIVNGLYDWIDSDDPKPNIRLPMNKWVESIQSNAGEVIVLVLDALPACTSEQMSGYSDEAPFDQEEIPLCRPPEPHYSMVVESGLEALPSLLETIPNEQNLGEMLFADATAGELAAVKDAKQNIRMLRAVMGQGWLVFVALFLLAIPLGARTGDGALRWAGWPLVLTGLAVLVLAIVILLAANQYLVTIGDRLSENVPEALVFPLLSILEMTLSAIIFPFGLQGVGMLLLGGLLLLGASIVARRASKKAATAGQVGPIDATPPPEPVPPLEQFQEAAPEAEAPDEEEEEEDDDTPSGMFG